MVAEEGGVRVQRDGICPEGREPSAPRRTRPGIGALVGGWLCDRIGRKKIYQYDMLFYAFGMLWRVCALRPWMLVVGFAVRVAGSVPLGQHQLLTQPQGGLSS
jgi:MFS family permease